MILGIVDVGTNSIHLVIGVLGLNGKFHIMLKERDLTQLGEDGLASGRLKPAAIRRGMDVLGRFAETIRRCQVDHVEAVATSAVREAANGAEFVARIRATFGLPLRIISGNEEARLIYLGVLQAHHFTRPTLVVSIGGGSAQVICGDGAHLRYVASVPLGCARLGQRFIRRDPPTPSGLRELSEEVRRACAPLLRAVGRRRWEQMVGSSATIQQLMLAARKRRTGQRLSISLPRLRRLVGWLSRSTAQERMQLPGVDPRREDLLLTTGVVLTALMEGSAARAIRYAPGSLREGLVIDYLMRHRQRRLQHQLHEPLARLFGRNGAGRMPVAWRSGARATTVAAKRRKDHA
jgi:exopolyphosphatase/guanosine-5'-triphosphate,3'-diphosphate pyrophosphatase